MRHHVSPETWRQYTATEEPWDQEKAEPNKEEPGDVDRGLESASTEESAPEMMEEIMDLTDMVDKRSTREKQRRRTEK